MSRFLAFVSSLSFSVFAVCLVLASATMLPRVFASEPLTSGCPDPLEQQCNSVDCACCIGELVQCVPYIGTCVCPEVPPDCYPCN